MIHLETFGTTRQVQWESLHERRRGSEWAFVTKLNTNAAQSQSCD